MLIRSQNGRNVIRTQSVYAESFPSGKHCLFAADQFDPEGIPIAEYSSAETALSVLDLIFDNAAQGKPTDLRGSIPKP